MAKEVKEVKAKNTEFVCMTRAYGCVPSANIFLRGSLIEIGAEKIYL